MKRSRMKATEIVVEQEASESSSEDLSFSDILYDGAGEASSDDLERATGESSFSMSSQTEELHHDPDPIAGGN